MILRSGAVSSQRSAGEGRADQRVVPEPEELARVWPGREERLLELDEEDSDELEEPEDDSLKRQPSEIRPSQ